MVLKKVTVNKNEPSTDLLSLIFKASHDLKGPIRTIKSFTQILSKSIDDRLKNNEKDLFHFIFEATNDLENLINQLVAFSKTEQCPLNFSEIDFGNFAELMKLNLQKKTQETEATLNLIYSTEKISGDRDKLNLLLTNLILNALKFQPKDQKPIVDLEISNTGAYWQIAVKDNGIGIATEHFETILQPFEKLHGNSVYKGAGIGLAICANIAKAHKGSIKVESTPNEGSTFSFILPK